MEQDQLYEDFIKVLETLSEQLDKITLSQEQTEATLKEIIKDLK